MRKMRWILIVAVFATLGAGLAYALNGVESSAKRLDAAQAQSIARDKAITANQSALTDANAKVTALSDQLENLGKEPVVSPSPVTVTGERGPGPTLGQVIVAIQNYCIANGECRGPAGVPGKSITGPKGNTGKSITGPAGESITGPQGVPGTDGKDGTNGTDAKPARSITSTQCGTDGRWTVTYSDGTSEDAGACQVTPGPPA